ncbi:hypothetical protein J6590_041341 [Homalodisca vitripennis]|nr:hypothetical protein J6590_041341 [Homalodisca vitripennis]
MTGKRDARYVAKRLYRCGSICKTEHLLMFNLRPLLIDQWSSTDQNLYQRLQGCKVGRVLFCVLQMTINPRKTSTVDSPQASTSIIANRRIMP